MSKKTAELKKYKLLQTIKHSSRSGNREGYVKIHVSNCLIHEETKLKIAYKLKKQGFYVLSETTFLNGKRADLVAISPDGTGYIIEVLHSESEERYNEKLNTYPIDWDMVAVNCKDFDIETWEL